MSLSTLVATAGGGDEPVYFGRRLMTSMHVRGTPAGAEISRRQRGAGRE